MRRARDMDKGAAANRAIGTDKAANMSKLGAERIMAGNCADGKKPTERKYWIDAYSAVVAPAQLSAEQTRLLPATSRLRYNT